MRAHGLASCLVGAILAVAGCGDSGGDGGSGGTGGRAGSGGIAGGGGAAGGGGGMAGTGGGGGGGGSIADAAPADTRLADAGGLDAGAAGDAPASDVPVGDASGTGDGPAGDTSTIDATSGPDTPAGGAFVPWNWNGSMWLAMGTPPACANPLVFAPPVTLSTVTSVLYPGQIRGGNYKAHGGFRFADGTHASVTVRAPMAGYVYRGVRYIEAGEVQYMFDVINPCGVMYRLDHLLTLSPKLQAIADTLPPATESSATTQVAPGQHAIAQGDVLATAVGFARTGNTFVDWGVYDLRQRNAASSDAAWLSSHPGEQAPYAICWLDNFTSAESAQLRALPPADGVAGRMSDYCR